MVPFAAIDFDFVAYMACLCYPFCRCVSNGCKAMAIVNFTSATLLTSVAFKHNHKSVSPAATSGKHWQAFKIPADGIRQ